MSFFFNGAQANVVLSGGIASLPNAPCLGATQTPFNFQITATGANQAITVVPAGKRVNIFGMTCYTAGGGDGILKKDDSTEVWRGTPSARTHFTFPVSPWTWEEGEDVLFNAGAGQVWHGWGVIYDA
jgi:hypothetical protein